MEKVSLVDARDILEKAGISRLKAESLLFEAAASPGRKCRFREGSVNIAITFTPVSAGSHGGFEITVG